MPGSTVVMKVAGGTKPVTIGRVIEDYRPFPVGSPVEEVWNRLYAEGFVYGSDTLITSLRSVWPEEHLRHEPARQHSDGRIHDGWYYRSPVPGVGVEALLRAVQLRAMRSTPRWTNRAAAVTLFAATADDVAEELRTPVTLRVKCGGDRHILRWDGGVRLHADDHDAEAVVAELTLVALGSTPPAGCLDVLHRWANGRSAPDVPGFWPTMRAAQTTAGYLSPD